MIVLTALKERAVAWLAPDVLKPRASVVQIKLKEQSLESSETRQKTNQKNKKGTAQYSPEYWKAFGAKATGNSLATQLSSYS